MADEQRTGSEGTDQGRQSSLNESGTPRSAGNMNTTGGAGQSGDRPTPTPPPPSDAAQADVSAAASKATRRVGDEVNHQSQQVKDSAASTVDTARNAASNVAQTVSDQASQVKDQATAAVVGGASQVKDRLADNLERAADAVNQRGQAMDRPEIAQPVAERLRGSARYLRENEVDDLVDDFVGLVRRHPLEMMAGAFLFGYLFGKALRGDSDEPWE